MNRVIALAIAVALSWSSLSIAAVISVSTESEGRAASYHEALNNALVEAIAQVRGKQLASELNVNTIEVSEEKGGESSFYASNEYKNKIYAATKGVVSSYEILSANENSDGLWQVRVNANISKFERSAKNNRKRIAILPFSANARGYDLAGELLSATKAAELIQGELTNYFVQGRKFAVLERTDVDALLNEKQLVKLGQTNVQDLAILGETLVADFVLVGTIEQLSVEAIQRQSRLSARTIDMLALNIRLQFKLIETATQQIVLADNVVLNDMLQRGGDSLMTDISDRVAESISKNVLAQVYPVTLISRSGSEAVLNQGGKTLKAGEQYKVFRRGEKQFDPYTKEYLGKTGHFCCLITISRTTPKQAYGELSEFTAESFNGYQPKDFILREKVALRKKELTKKVKKMKTDSTERYQNDW